MQNTVGRLTRYVNQRSAAEFFLRRRGHTDEMAVYQALRLVFVASATNVEWVIDMRIV